MAHDEEAVPRATMDLIGQIMSQNVRDLAFTTDRIIESLETQALRLAQTVVDINEVLDRALVIDRKTEVELRLLAGQINTAYDIIERKGLAS